MITSPHTPSTAKPHRVSTIKSWSADRYQPRTYKEARRRETTYYEITKAKKVVAVHPNAVAGRIHAGRTVYFARQLPPTSYDPRHLWIPCWAAPAAVVAAQRALDAAGYQSFSERVVRSCVRWQQGRYTRPPKQTFRPVPTSPGQMWVQVPVPRAFRVATVPDLPFILAMGRRIAKIAPMRPALLSAGNPIWADLPPVGLAQSPRAWAMGDLVYVPSRGLWARYWGPATDRHYVELGAVHVPDRPEDPTTRDRHRVGMVPVARCVRPTPR